MKDVNKYLQNELEQNSTIIVSCSGGPDSMCLLYLLLSFKNTFNLNIICAHVNHNVREESVEEEEFVKKYCESNDIKFECLQIDSYRGNFHNDARVLRYNFLNDLLTKYNSKFLFTAHHGDDLVETILMRISRGSNLIGYSGFKINNKIINHKVIRPLIFVTKSEIENYNSENNIEYRIDITNKSLEYTRNKYRHIALPALKKIDNDIHLKFLKFSEKLIEYDDFVKSYIISKGLLVDNYIDVPLYLKEDEFIRKSTIELYISNLQKVEQFYTTDNIVFEIDKLLKSEKGKANINLPNGFFGIKKNKKFTIEK
ncbi:MAG: tRNA lysidine(34) synthetase TilS [bacterium]